MRIPFLSCCVAMLLISATVLAQTGDPKEKLDIKFGKVTAADFDLSKHSIDTGANAVVIADLGSSAFEGNNDGWFTLVFKHHQRIKILNKNGLDAATYEIPLFIGSNKEEKLEKLKASTFNLENGTVEEVKMDENAVFKDKLSKNWIVKKFTLPNVKAGSVIDVTYTIKSDFLHNLREWEFQGSQYPRLWSEYTVEMPEFFNYVVLSQGYLPFYIKDAKTDRNNYSVLQPSTNTYERSSVYNFQSNVTVTRWVMKDVPRLKREPFTTSLNNHISKIEFQLSQYRFPDMPVKNLMTTWPTLSEGLLADEQFGAHLAKANNWLDDEMRSIVAGATTDLEKAKRIFAFVRDKFTCTSQSGKYMSAAPKQTLKDRKGNVADINMLLVAMLRHERIDANPLILSTREHGFTHDFYPLIEQYNYLVCHAVIEDQVYELDATESTNGFGHLPSNCYNGHARIITKMPMPVYLSPDSVREKKVTTVMLMNNDQGVWEGSVSSLQGYYEAQETREYVKKNGETNFFKKLKNQMPAEIEIRNTHIDSLKMPDEPLQVKYDIDLKAFTGEDVIYLNPMLGEENKENIFKAAERYYPVEMPFTTDEMFVANIDIPKGYVVDEIPKSLKVSLNEKDGFFEYLISKTEDAIMMRSRIVIKKANFEPDDYNTLREFFTHVVKKQSEQIVFKKKS